MYSCVHACLSMYSCVHVRTIVTFADKCDSYSRWTFQIERTTKTKPAAICCVRPCARSGSADLYVFLQAHAHARTHTRTHARTRTNAQTQLFSDTHSTLVKAHTRKRTPASTRKRAPTYAPFTQLQNRTTCRAFQYTLDFLFSCCLFPLLIAFICCAFTGE